MDRQPNTVETKVAQNNTEQLENLAFSLSERERPALVWLTTDSMPTTYETYFKLKQKFSQYDFIDIHIDDIHKSLNDDEVSLFNMIKQQIPSEVTKSKKIEHIVNVFGIDKYINKYQHDAPIIRQLNFERELLYRTFNCILIIWTAPYSTEIVSQNAVDFWDWMTYSFYFKNNNIKSIGVFVYDNQQNNIKISHPKISFIYTNADKEYKEKLEGRLQNTMENYGVTWRSFTTIEIANYYSELEQDNIILFFVSDQLLTPANLQAVNNILNYRKSDTVLIPVILSSCNWKDTGLGVLQAVPDNEKPILSSDWKNQELAYDNIVNRLDNILHKLTTNNPPEDNCTFIWHAKKDFDYAQRVFKYLENRNLRPWLAAYEKIKKHKTLDALKQTIDKAEHCIIILSKHTADEEGDTKKILEYAIEKNNKYADETFTIAIKTDDVDTKNSPYLLSIPIIHANISSRSRTKKEAFSQSMEDLRSEMTKKAGFEDFETLRKEDLKRLTLDAYQKYENSLTTYKERYRLRPIDYIKAGLYNFANENYEEAIKGFHYGINSGYPESPELLSKIGACLIMLKEEEEAEYVLRESIKLNKAYPLSWYNLGILQKSQKKYKEAIESFQNSIDNMEATGRKYVVARNNLATTYTELYKANNNETYLQEAIDILESIEEQELDNPHLSSLTAYNLACMYALKSSFDKSLTQIRLALKADPKKVFNAYSEFDLQNLKNTPKTGDKFQKILKMTAQKYKQNLQNEIFNKVQADNTEDLDKIGKSIKKLKEIFDV